jgi:hypothetical protein
MLLLAPELIVCKTRNNLIGWSGEWSCLAIAHNLTHYPRAAFRSSEPCL